MNSKLHSIRSHKAATEKITSSRIRAEKKRIVQDLFIDTADENYITARWCFFQGLRIDYAWLAVHTLEKYMKSALLLNGRSGKEYCDDARTPQPFRHDIVILYEQVKAIARDLLPSNLMQPDELEVAHWLDETPEGFLQRLYRDGNANNRYQIFGFLQHREDLFKLDSMVFALRRICVPLDACAFLGRHNPRPKLSRERDLLAMQPKWWRVSQTGKLEKAADGKRGEELRESLLNLNFPFAPDDYRHGSVVTGTAWHNPVLVHALLEPLERREDGNTRAVAREICDWVLENIQLPHDVKLQLLHARRGTQ